MVEGIVRIGTDLYVNPFREVERFTQPKVNLFQARASQLITALVSERTGGGYGKSSLIEPLIRTTVCQLGVADHIGEPGEVGTAQRIGISTAGS